MHLNGSSIDVVHKYQSYSIASSSLQTEFDMFRLLPALRDENSSVKLGATENSGPGNDGPDNDGPQVDD